MSRTLVAVAVAVVLTAGATFAIARYEPVDGDATRSPVATTGGAPVDPPPAVDGSPAPDPAPAEGGFVIWARGDLPVSFADAVAGLPGVTASAHVRSSTLGLVAAFSADGAVATSPSGGFRIPVAVAAIDPPRYVRTLPPGSDRDALSGLAPGRIVLSETGARLRGVGVGGRIDLAGLPGLEVVAVVPDGTVGRSEIVLHLADAAAAGLDDDGTVYVRHDAAAGPETAALTERIDALVPPDVTARIVDVGAGEPRRRAPLVLSLAEVKDRFGEFAFRPRSGVREIDVDPAFTQEHIVAADVPVLGSVTCHRLIVDDLRAALQEVVDSGLAGEIDPERYAGCYHPRRISTSGDRLSHHSWGIALDINVDLALPDLGPPPHPGVVAAFEAHGFRWGGDFLHPDNHHFEWVGAAASQRR